jgi:hypothetical protein
MTDIPASLTTPDVMESSLGTLMFNDGVPSDETVAKVYENLDLTRALDVYMSG